ncbi:MAG: hypothetical protein KC615_25845, partial [Anaerolineae bacterium]|nr:hypothetical protein [Anaerolineae bacterium]
NGDFASKVLVAHKVDPKKSFLTTNWRFSNESVLAGWFYATNSITLSYKTGFWFTWQTQCKHFSCL